MSLHIGGWDYDMPHFSPVSSENQDNDGIVIDCEYEKPIRTIEGMYNRYQQIFKEINENKIWELIPESESIVTTLENYINHADTTSCSQQLFTEVIDFVCENCIELSNKLDDIKNQAQEISLALEKINQAKSPYQIFDRLNYKARQTPHTKYTKEVLDEIENMFHRKVSTVVPWNDVKCSALKLHEMIISAKKDLEDYKQQTRWYSRDKTRVKTYEERIKILEEFYTKITEYLTDYTRAKEQAVTIVSKKMEKNLCQ